MNAKSRRGLALLLALVMGVSALTSCTEQETTQNPKDETDNVSVILESDNYSVSPEELAVYEYQAALSGLINQFWYYQYGLIQDTEGVTKVFSNAYDYAYDILPDAIAKGTYKAQAYENAHQYVVYCEGALAKGEDQKLKNDVENEIDQYIDNLKETAESKNLSLKEFLRTYMGKSVKEDDVRSAMEKCTLGYKYAEIRKAEISDALTSQELEEYVKDHPDAFYKSYYTSYEFTNVHLAHEAKQCSSVDELALLLARFVTNQEFDRLYKENFEDAGIENPHEKETLQYQIIDTLLSRREFCVPGSQDPYPEHFNSASDSAYDRAAYQIVTALQPSLDAELKKIQAGKSVSYVDLSGEDGKYATRIQQWIFSEGRKPGDCYVVPETKPATETSPGKSIHTWCLLTEHMVLDEKMTRNVCYVKFTDEEAYTAEEKANAFLYAFLDSKSAEKFDELAVQLEVIDPNTSAMREYATETSVKITSEKLAHWLFNESRAVGDADVIQDGDAYYVAYYAHENEANWCIQARNALTDIQLKDWFEDIEAKINLQSHVDPSEWESESETNRQTASIAVRPLD